MIRVLLLTSAIVAAAPLKAAERQFSITDFDRIEVSNGIDLDITVDADFAITAETDREAQLDLLSIEKRGDTLHITAERDESFFAALRSYSPLLMVLEGGEEHYRVSVSMPSLRSLDANSGAQVEAENIRSDALDITTSSGAYAEFEGIESKALRIQASSGSNQEISGQAEELVVGARSGARIALDEITAKSVTFTTSSGSDLEAEGSCSSLRAESSSGSHVDADEFVCAVVTAEVRSGSLISVNATEQFTGHARSGGGIEVSGDPENVDLNDGYSGSIKFTH